MKRTVWLFVFASLIITVTVFGSNVFSKQLDAVSDDSHLAGELTLFAAASLTEAFQALGDAFIERHPDVTLTYNLAGSQQLAHQLAQGAPADLFASANQQQMDVVVDAGRVAVSDVRALAHNRLQVVLPIENSANITTFEQLAESGLKLVIADESAPIGRYTQILLDKSVDGDSLPAGFADRVRKNVVSYEQNVRAVLSKVSLGEADAGIVYQSDGVAADGAVRILEVPDDVNVTAVYPIAPVADGQERELASAFIDFVNSSEGQAILREFGFLPVSTEAD